MEKKTIAIIGIIVLFLILVCCCVAFVAVGASSLMIFSQDSTQSYEDVIDPEVFTPEEPMQLPTLELPENNQSGGSQPNPSGSQSSIPTDILSQMEQIEKEVEGIRGLPTANDLDRKTLSQQELRQRVMDDFFADYTEEDVRKDGIILNLFGLLERNFDLYELFVELYSEQIAGFYDDETKEMVVVQGDAFAGPERMTYAHEYTHALQDASYDLEDGLNLDDETCEVDTEYCAAVTALIEGDASFTETQWFLEHSSLQDKREVIEFYQEYESPIFDEMPAFLQEDLIFPYVKGLEFVTYLYENGGYDAVDEAYRNPPVSTEQILHPEKYPNDKPIPLELEDFSDLLGGGWEEIDRNTLGEFYFYLLLGSPLDETWALDENQALEATEGWGGDLYLVYHNTELDQDILISLSEWDSQSDAEEYWEAFTNYAAKRWGNDFESTNNSFVWSLTDQSIIIKQQGNQVLWIIAPEEAVAQNLSKQFSLFE